MFTWFWYWLAIDQYIPVLEKWSVTLCNCIPLVIPSEISSLARPEGKAQDVSIYKFIIQIQFWHLTVNNPQDLLSLPQPHANTILAYLMVAFKSF